MTRSARPAAIVWRCQSRTISAQPFRDPAADFAVLCRDGKCPTSGCMRDFETIGTCKAKTGCNDGLIAEQSKSIRRSLLTLIKLIGIVCLFFAYWRATL